MSDEEEFGARCKECKRIDFLPFECKHCKQVFCIEHRYVDNHICIFVEKKTLTECRKISKYQCFFCDKQSMVEIICKNCNNNFCLKHRYPEIHCCKIVKKKSFWKNFKNKMVQSKIYKFTLDLFKFS